MRAMPRRPPPELRELVLASAPTAGARALAELLVADDARSRTRGLDAITDVLLRHDDPEPSALDCALTLGTHGRYPESSALLVRLFRLLASIDDPPRSGRPDAPPASAVWERVLAASPRLLRHARTASDPAASRAATLLASRFPDLDEETEPLLSALLSGAPDEDERARLLYALARVQATRGARFHSSVADAAAGQGELGSRVAVALALAEHAPPLVLGRRLATVLREAEARPSALSDPRAWGRHLPSLAITRALTQLGP